MLGSRVRGLGSLTCFFAHKFLFIDEIRCLLQNTTSFAHPFTEFALPENQGLKNGDDAGKLGFSQCFKYERSKTGKDELQIEHFRFLFTLL